MNKHKLMALVVVVVVLIALLNIPFERSNENNSSVNPYPVDFDDTQYTESNDNDKLPDLINNKQSGVMIVVDAKVIKILTDDVKGSKHQRMILEVLNTHYSLLLAHNIDVAPRVPVKRNDIIRVYGQYEWNDKGGVIHWTHKDKKNKHPHGWVQYNNNRYQ